MTTTATILNIAAREIGYSRWNDPKPGTKYGRAYAVKHGRYFGTSGVPFCAIFVSWVFNQAGIQPPGGDFHYCPTGIQAMKDLHLEVDKHTALPGDIVFFDWGRDGVSDHVGIVEANRGSHLITIEGNTTLAYQSGGVARRTRNFTDVCNVFRPKYGKTIPTLAVLAIDGLFGPASIIRLQSVLGTPVDGTISSQPVANRQYLPNAAGGWEWVTHPKGSRVVTAWQKRAGATQDGLFGPATVKATQKFLGVAADGYAGPVTMRAWQTWLNEQ